MELPLAKSFQIFILLFLICSSTSVNYDKQVGSSRKIREDPAESKKVENVSSVQNKTVNGSKSASERASTNITSTATVRTDVVIIKDKGIPGTEEDSAEDKSSTNIDGITPINGAQEFDEKAVQRAAIVIGALGFLMLVYFGIKFVILKKRRVARSYGRLESSEMDLLDHDDDSEDDTLFDVRTLNS